MFDPVLGRVPSPGRPATARTVFKASRGIPPGDCCCAAGLKTAPTHISVGTRHLCTLGSNPT